MKIEKYKYLKDGKYKIQLKEKEYTIYEDVIIKNNILTKKEITEKELENYLKESNTYEAYYKALKYINIKIRCKKEIKKYLSNNNFSEKEINIAIEKLKKEGYINDELFANLYIIDQINLKNNGPLRIKKELINLDINEEIINKYLKEFTKDIELEKIKKQIKKDITLNKNKSSLMLKNKILINLIEKGFHKENILEILENVNYNEEEAYQKEYKKVYEKLSKKYKGKELEYKVKEKMYQKGFKIEYI